MEERDDLCSYEYGSEQERSALFKAGSAHSATEW